ncbi:MAG: histidine kinase [Candidatus Pristimantibacillus lignocellulolyticus]|uniref:histidine kinase n=1 Tax=Candidatus Pristimantibacillus lignocellulolyticus TaxID=2994561 RepID=A0A9J6ZI03_9BACL|nr:MAG: histidine kinase [Candidatus Pristimantibacillus lignocellulolyticus]
MNFQFLINKYRKITFKKRIIAIFIFSVLIPFICLGWISLYTINSILTNKVESSIQSNLKQEILGLENTLNNLNHVSQQLAFGIGNNKLLEQLYYEKDPFIKSRYRNDLKGDLNVITFSNPNVGLTFYYYNDKQEYDFENFPVRDNFSISKLPMMESYPEITYYGPHISNNRSNKNLVFSTMRKVNVTHDNIYVYIETGFNTTKSIFEPEDDIKKSRQILILNNNGEITYSQNEALFPVNSVFPFSDGEVTSGIYEQYIWHKEVSNQGWSIVSIFPKGEMNQEKNQWYIQISIFFLIFGTAVIIIGTFLSRMVYKPLEKFNSEIKTLINSNVKNNTDLINIPEFDYLLFKTREMKKKIWELYGQIEQKEKRRADLEVEKLLYQINPHFLMNTLDTVHWLAMMNGQKDIDKLVLSLNRLLQYNLGKMGDATTIGGEIEALKEYLQLQRIRYDFQFDVDIDVDDDAMLLAIPRFILQPLVENALYHGVSDEGYIHVDIRLGDKLDITIQDNGSGMSEEKVDQLLNDDSLDSQKVGMGIGMKYVIRILESNYGDQATFNIKSEIGKGTIVTMCLPVYRGDKL